MIKVIELKEKMEIKRTAVRKLRYLRQMKSLSDQSEVAEDHWRTPREIHSA
jgi:hypothetical protein